MEDKHNVEMPGSVVRCKAADSYRYRFSAACHGLMS